MASPRTPVTCLFVSSLLLLRENKYLKEAISSGKEAWEIGKLDTGFCVLKTMSKLNHRL